MKNTLLIANGTLILPDSTVERGGLYIEDSRIKALGRRYGDVSSALAQRVIDAGGGFILPGLIDLHSDAIEKEIEPRPGAYFPPELAFRELEKKTVGQGITTMFHSFSFAGAELGIRNDDEAVAAVKCIVKSAGKQFIIRNKIHLRYEITDTDGLEKVMKLMRDGLVDLLSVMDHTPGQGQFKTLESYRNYLQKTYHFQLSETDKIIAGKENARKQGEENAGHLLVEAASLGIPTASHDDDDPDRVRYFHRLGVRISDFPVSLEAAREAHALNNFVCVGAPNVVRGGSQKNNLRAEDAIEEKLADVLCSDYYPPSLIHSVFLLAGKVTTMAGAVKMATLNPARAVGLAGDLGSLEEGKIADVIVVQNRGNMPLVTHSVVNGYLVYFVNYHCAKEISRRREQPA